MEAATVMLTVVGVDVATWGCSWAFRFMMSGCTVVEWRLGLSSDPRENLRLSVAMEVRSMPLSVMITGYGLVAIRKSTTLPLGSLGPCSTLEVPGTVEILHKEIFSIDKDPRL